jgi:nicotinate phosphoribosyltransferase
MSDPHRSLPARLLLPDPARLALATDLYQLTMMAAYRRRPDPGEAVFELFVRHLPASRAFLVAAGLEQALAYLEALRFDAEDVAWLREQEVFAKVDDGFFEWLRGYRFRGTVDAIPEGTVVFHDEPLLRVRAPLAEAQLVETVLLNTLNTQTLQASKAARVRIASRDKTVVDFGTRRAHGTQAALYAARASWIAGLDGTSNVLAGRWLGLPVLGTAAHAFIMSFRSEEEAFRAYHDLYPEHCVLLVDTYDTLEGVDRAIDVVGEEGALRGIRLDSGDLEQLARESRARLDAAGMTDTAIVASGDLNEDEIARLLAAGAPIDSFGVGTELATSRDQPALGGVFKLVERRVNGERIGVMKRSAHKVTWPGAKQVHRIRDAAGILLEDVVELVGAPPPTPPEGGRVEPLLRPVFAGGRPLGTPPLSEARARCARELASLPDALRRLRDPASPPVRIGASITALAETL